MTQPDEDLTLLDAPLDPAELDLEAPLADAAEQAAPVAPISPSAVLQVPFEANEYDAIEQAQIIPDSDDDYR